MESVAGNDSLSIVYYSGTWISNGNGGWVYNGGWQDSDGDAVTFLKLTETTHGDLNLDASSGVFTYQPDAGYVGEDSFTYQLSDGIATSAGTATVTLNVTNVYPAAISDSFYEIYGPVVQGNVSVNDNLTQAPGGAGGWVDGDAVTFIEEGPHLSGLSLNAQTGAFTYQKPTGYYAGTTKEFKYRISDGVPLPSMMMNMPSVATVTMTIAFPFSAVDDDSYANTDPLTMSQYPEINYFVFKDDVLSITAAQGVLKNDASSEYIPFLKAVQQGDGQYGTFVIDESGSFTYTPYSWVFESPLFTDMGLSDTCQYVDKDQNGKLSAPGTVKVDMAELYIMRNGQAVDLNGSLLQPWVGEKIAVSVGIRGQIPANQGITDYQWCMAGTAVDGYTGYNTGDAADTDGAEVADARYLNGDELNNASIDFYWVDKGYHDLTVSVEVLGEPVFLSVRFNVVHPIVTVTSVTTSVTLQSSSQQVGAFMGEFPPGFIPGVTPALAGITVSRTQDRFAEQYGTFRWTQIVVKDYVTKSLAATATSPASNMYSSVSGLVDFGPEYTNTTPSPSGTASMQDSPEYAFPNVPRLVGFSRDFVADLYLMYKPNGNDSIWVPIQVVHWGFHFDAMRGFNNEWILASSGILTPNPSGVDTSEFPEWTAIESGGPKFWNIYLP